MKISELPNAPQWLLDATTENADVEYNPYGIVIWLNGDFRGGNFWSVACTKNPLSIFGLKWPITISDTRMQIGCERHQFDGWSAFSDEEINDMHINALKFWHAHKIALLALCELHRQPEQTSEVTS